MSRPESPPKSPRPHQTDSPPGVRSSQGESESGESEQKSQGESGQGESGQQQGRDVGWAVAQGETRPIREVIESQKRQHRSQDKALREAAYRERAWRQALLLSCLCCYPLQLADTESQHEHWCPSHLMHLSKKAAAAATTEEIDRG